MIRELRAPLRLATLLVVAFFFADFATATTPRTGDEAIAFAHVAVVPMDREVTLEDYTVVVRGDRISDMGPAQDVRVPPGTIVIPAQGLYLMPGLADMHVHLEDEEDALLLFLANGVTTVRNMWGKPEHLEWRRRIASGERFGPTVYTTGPITDGNPPMWEGSTIVTTPDAAERELIAQKELGYDGMKVMTNLSPEVYDAILAASKRHDFPIYGHVQTLLGYREELGRGQRTFEHMFDLVYALLPDHSVLRQKIVGAWRHEFDPIESWKVIGMKPYEEARADLIPAVAAEAAASGAWFCPTLVATAGFHIDASAAETRRGRSYNRYVPRDRLRRWEEADAFQLSTFADAELDGRALQMERRSVEALQRAGAHLLAGTDTHPDLPYLVPGFSLHEELGNLLRAGLTPFEVLTAATTAPAAVLGASDEFGAVAVGRRADLLLVDTSPLVSVDAAASRIGVMSRGQWFPEEELQARLEDLAAAYARQDSESSQEPR